MNTFFTDLLSYVFMLWFRNAATMEIESPFGNSTTNKIDGRFVQAELGHSLQLWVVFLWLLTDSVAQEEKPGRTTIGRHRLPLRSVSPLVQGTLATTR